MRAPVEVISVFALVGGIVYVLLYPTGRNLRYAAVGALWVAELILTRWVGTGSSSRYFCAIIIPAIILSAIVVFAVHEKLDKWFPKKLTLLMAFAAGGTLIVYCLANTFRVANSNHPVPEIGSALARDAERHGGDYAIVDFSNNNSRFRYLLGKPTDFVPGDANTEAGMVEYGRKRLSPLPVGRVYYFIRKEKFGSEPWTGKTLGVSENYFQKICSVGYLPRKKKQLSLYRLST